MRSIILIIGLILILGCKKQNHHFYSPDRTKCFSILTEGDIRYFIDGEHDNVPDSNYVKISLSEIDRHVADQTVGCWGRDGFEWILVMDNVVVLENKLDIKKFSFKNKFPRDSSGFPTLKDYNSGIPKCFSISYEYAQLINVEGSIIKEK